MTGLNDWSEVVRAGGVLLIKAYFMLQAVADLVLHVVILSCHLFIYFILLSILQLNCGRQFKSWTG